jgi:hypothetical protein
VNLAVKWRYMLNKLCRLKVGVYTVVNFDCTPKCTNRLQLMDCKCEVDPTGNCVFEEKFCF